MKFMQLMNLFEIPSNVTPISIMDRVHLQFSTKYLHYHQMVKVGGWNTMEIGMMGMADGANILELNTEEMMATSTSGTIEL